MLHNEICRSKQEEMLNCQKKKLNPIRLLQSNPYWNVLYETITNVSFKIFKFSSYEQFPSFKSLVTH